MLNLDVITSALDLFTTYMGMLGSLWVWPLTLFSSVLNVVLFTRVGIYGDAILAAYYFLSAIYGWYYWRCGINHRCPVTVMSQRERYFTATITVISVIAFGLFLKIAAKSTIPYWDATTTVLSIVAQWLFCRKKLETWVLWVTIDSINLVLYPLKGIPVNGAITLVYFIIAASGYRRWRREQMRLNSSIKNNELLFSQAKIQRVILSSS